MTLLLASVTGPDEAALVLARGADIIDLKDASKGPLGAVEAEVLRATVAAVGGRRPVSAVTGNLAMEPDVIVAAVAATARAKVDYVKVGLFPDAQREKCIHALSSLARQTTRSSLPSPSTSPRRGTSPRLWFPHCLPPAAAYA